MATTTKNYAPVKCPICGNETLDEQGDCTACDFSAREEAEMDDGEERYRGYPFDTWEEYRGER